MSPMRAGGHSCLYTGWVRHRRWRPRPHAFRYRLCMLYLDLAELERGEVFAGRWLWSSERRAPARFRRRDHFGDPDRPLSICVAELVERETGRAPAGPIRLLTHPSYFGYCFNPISIFYCFDAAGDDLDTVVAEVSNTPWGERRCYVLDLRGDRPAAKGPHVHRCEFRKTLHVSPFMPLDQRYRWRCNRPDRLLTVHMDVLQRQIASGDGSPVPRDPLFDATLRLERRELSGARLALALFGQPPMTLKVVAAIYWQALRLLLKRMPVFDHPGPSPDGRDEPTRG